MLTEQAARDAARKFMKQQGMGGLHVIAYQDALTQLILTTDREAIAEIELVTLRNTAKAAADDALSPFRAANLVAPDGGPRRVLGKFQTTKDGYIIASQWADVWAIHRRTNKVYATTSYHAGPREVWSSEAAAASALAARGEVGG